MAYSKGEERRNIVPRWRNSITSAQLGEMNPLPKQPQVLPGTASSVMEKVSDWRTNPIPGVAGDLLSAAYALGRLEDARDAARFILEENQFASPLSRRIASCILGMSDSPRSDYPGEVGILARRLNISTSRSRTRDDPRNAIAWVDLYLASSNFSIH